MRAPLFSLFATCLALTSITGVALAEPETPSSITVSATATRSAPADDVTITIGVVSEAEAAAEAMNENTAKMTRIIELLDAQGIGRDAITTDRISLSPRYRDRITNPAYRDREIAGYEASNLVKIHMSDVDLLGVALDTVVQAGVNSIDNIDFSISDTTDLEQAARLEAARTLRAKAEAYAEAMGSRVLGVLSVREQNSGRMPIAQERMLMADTKSVPVVAGDIGVSATLTGTFEVAFELE